MGGRKEKYRLISHQMPPNLAPQNYATKIFETNKKYMENSKDWKTGTVWGCAGTKKFEGTRKHDNPLKGIRHLVPNRT